MSLWNDSFRLCINFFHFLCKPREFMQFVNNLCKRLIQSYYFWYNSIDSYKLWSFDWNLNDSLNFVDTWYLNDLIDYFFNHVWDFHYFLYYSFDRNYFLYYFFNLNNSIVIIWNLIVNNFDIFLNKKLFYNSIPSLNSSRHFYFYFNNTISNSIYFMNDRNYMLNWNHFLLYQSCWDGYLDRHNPFNLKLIICLIFNHVWNWLFNHQLYWNLLSFNCYSRWLLYHLYSDSFCICFIYNDSVSINKLRYLDSLNNIVGNFNSFNFFDLNRHFS